MYIYSGRPPWTPNYMSERRWNNRQSQAVLYNTAWCITPCCHPLYHWLQKSTHSLLYFYHVISTLSLIECPYASRSIFLKDYSSFLFTHIPFFFSTTANQESIDILLILLTIIWIKSDDFFLLYYWKHVVVFSFEL